MKLFAIMIMVCIVGYLTAPWPSMYATTDVEYVMEDHISSYEAKFIERLEDIVFIHDATSGLCFSYFWDRGGPAMTNVPCDGLTIDYEINTGQR